MFCSSLCSLLKQTVSLSGSFQKAPTFLRFIERKIKYLVWVNYSIRRLKLRNNLGGLDTALSLKFYLYTVIFIQKCISSKVMYL